MPRYVSRDGHHALFVDGAPYSIMAAQLHNSSAWPQVLPQALDAVQALHANTVEAPVYWEQFEPAPGRYDYRNVDALVEQSRARGLRLIVLWFGTWKNGQMHYVPEWIKRDPATYPRMRDAKGEPVDVLSPHAPANLQADARAFVALMQHLRKIDAGRYTVIAVQVQNEPGAIGTVRDHGAVPIARSMPQCRRKCCSGWASRPAAGARCSAAMPRKCSAPGATPATSSRSPPPARRRTRCRCT
ncbi:hypothetical protein XTPLMG730_3146 [Xanthomonas translucens pv. phlei]|uniref:Glycoside hydrolase 35 catalytic domain-containing protein n=1 Tax=Xanthomonas graminis pv. phlei TaxID=487906 RepID=A0A0K3A027_9XANT|nr:hypothetical protein XTPLMG730_3146 [Xanthomonas translucens pv. phlei]